MFVSLNYCKRDWESDLILSCFCSPISVFSEKPILIDYMGDLYTIKSIPCALISDIATL